MDFGPNPELEAIRDHHSLPLGNDLDRVLRYETTIQRQLTYAIDQLERLQRARKGEKNTRAGERSGFKRSVAVQMRFLLNEANTSIVFSQNGFRQPRAQHIGGSRVRTKLLQRRIWQTFVRNAFK
jgi:hypothetical protein